MVHRLIVVVASSLAYDFNRLSVEKERSLVQDEPGIVSNNLINFVNSEKTERILFIVYIKNSYLLRFWRLMRDLNINIAYRL